MKRENDSFEKWFVSRFGARPCGDSIFELEERVRDARMAVLVAESRLRRTAAWEDWRHATLLAWHESERNK